MEPHPAPLLRRDVAQRRSPPGRTMLPCENRQPSWAARPIKPFADHRGSHPRPVPLTEGPRWRVVSSGSREALTRPGADNSEPGDLWSPVEPGQIAWVRFHGTIPPRRVTPCPNSGQVERHVTMPARLATVGRHASSCEEVSFVEPTDMSPRYQRTSHRCGTGVTRALLRGAPSVGVVSAGDPLDPRR